MSTLQSGLKSQNQKVSLLALSLLPQLLNQSHSVYTLKHCLQALFSALLDRFADSREKVRIMATEAAIQGYKLALSKHSKDQLTHLINYLDREAKNCFQHKSPKAREHVFLLTIHY